MENNRMYRDGRQTGPKVPPTRRNTDTERERLRQASAGLRMPGSDEPATPRRQQQPEAERRTEDMKKSGGRRASEKARARKRKIKRLWKILGVEVVLFCCLLIAYGVFYVNGKLNQLNYNDMDESELGINEGISDITKGEYTTIALFGLDSRDVTSDTGNRSDTILIANINNKTKEVRLISVYRDTYLELENPNGSNNGLYTKITHAYAYGGPKAAVATLNKNLDLQITEYVTVNFASLTDVVNDLGGITVNVDEDERQSINIWIPETAQIAGMSYTPLYETGDVTLDGLQAVTYCRIRNIGNGDIDRAGRQREVLAAILDKAKQSDLNTLNQILDDVLPEVSTSLTRKELLSLMGSVFDYELTENEGFPFVYRMTTAYDQAVGQDLSVDIPANLENNVILLHAFLYDTAVETAESGDAPEGTEGEAGNPEDAITDEKEEYTPSAQVLRISGEIESNTGTYPPEDASFRGGFN